MISKVPAGPWTFLETTLTNGVVEILPEREIERARRVPFGVDVGCDVVAAAAKGGDIIESVADWPIGSERVKRQVDADRVAIDRASHGSR